MKRLLGLMMLAGLWMLAGCNGSSNMAREQLDRYSDHGFMTKRLTRGMWTRKYAVFVPYSYKPGTAQKYPTIVFLHGIGEGSGLGEGNLKNLTVGLGPAVARKAESFEFIVIFPQSDGGWSPSSDYTQDMLAALAATEKEYPVDRDRVYLTGLSTGGAGTWAIGARYHETFAAIVPMASNGSSQSDAANLTGVPVRAYCSVFGDAFAGFNDLGMVHKIKELNPQADAKFTSTPTIGHDCWEDVYRGEALFAWLKQQRKSAGVARGPVSEPTRVASVVQPAVPVQAVPVSAPAARPVVAPAPVVVQPAAPAVTPVRSVAPAAPVRTVAPAAPVQRSGGLSDSKASVDTPW